MFRTVLIKKSSKLQYLQGYIIIFDGDIERKIFLKDISALIIESTGTIITFPLLIALIKNNVSVIFCDEKHNPIGTINGISNHFNNSGNIMKQLRWEETEISIIWKEIVKSKILLQKQVLQLFGKEKQNILESYANTIDTMDKTNREGLAAKVYFFELFGKNFNRTEEGTLNSLLDYGYSIILSCFNREIIGFGYLTQIGIFHRGKTNPYNLSSDFMEPFRPLIDTIAYGSLYSEDPLKKIRKVLTKKVMLNNEERYIDDAIGVYVNNLIRFLNKETTDLPNLQLKELDHYLYDKSNEIDCNV